MKSTWSLVGKLGTLSKTFAFLKLLFAAPRIVPETTYGGTKSPYKRTTCGLSWRCLYRPPVNFEVFSFLDECTAKFVLTTDCSLLTVRLERDLPVKTVGQNSCFHSCLVVLVFSTNSHRKLAVSQTRFFIPFSSKDLKTLENAQT